MEFSQEKRHIMQTMGISDFDVKRYLEIDEKLKTYTAVKKVRSEDDRFDQGKSAETHSALVNAVREQIERSMQPLRTTVDDIKATVARELEEERFLLRDHLAAAQKEIMVQLQRICHIQDQQLNQPEPCHGYPGKDIEAEETKAKEQLAARQFEPKIPTEGLQARIRTTKERRDVKDHDQQIPDINSDLLWFKEQVQSLQHEQKQYRQELSRQGQHQLLQNRVSVSKLELKEELERNKDEIINSMKALWAFTEAELNDSSKSLNEKTTESVRKLSRCQEETKNILAEILTSELKAIHQIVEETKENVFPNLSKNKVYKSVEETKQMLAEILATTSDTRALTEENASGFQKVNPILEGTKEIGSTKLVKNQNTALENSDMSKTIHNLKGKLDVIQKQVESNTISVYENAMRDLQIVFIGQAQRIIQKAVNPSCDPYKVFHFYIKNFHQLEGSGKTVLSLPYVVPMDDSLFALQFVAHFKAQTSEMILGVVSPADPREFGLEFLGIVTLKLIINSKVIGPDGHEDILVAMDRVINTHTFLRHTNDNYLQMAEPISCPKLVSLGYNSFKDRSVLIELKIG
ncbi:hypothetical protein PoB_005678000 [Plakobranchus ocellatus]|uniref:RPGR-interacting protein 1 first C2 domain-containing protein n=1 Tax=Plakobranchus ocellatus TaxID=259542 RepID=A0AAV4CEY9_9GAST|nr:hypothetical protein PoB_005678000 [Plakobranchus ocellatus]